jgi:hypothetical protein
MLLEEQFIVVVRGLLEVLGSLMSLKYLRLNE